MKDKKRKKPKRARLKDIHDDGRVIARMDQLPTQNTWSRDYIQATGKRPKHWDEPEKYPQEDIKFEKGDRLAMFWAALQVFGPIVLVYVAVYTALVVGFVLLVR